MLPIIALTWVTSRGYGIALLVISSAIWFAADNLSGHTYSHYLIPYWNMVVRFAFFIITVITMSKLKKALEMESARKGGWPVTFSIGVVTYKTKPASIAEILRSADELMYSGKRSGKNSVRYEVRS